MNPAIKLVHGREKSVLRRHPWIFSGSIASVEGNPAAGDAVEVQTQHGDFLAWAFYSPASQLRARAVSWRKSEVPGLGWLRMRLADAIAARAPLASPNTNAMRLVHGEGDGLPGLVIDRYNRVLSVQILSAGFEKFREDLGPMLLELVPDADLAWERSDADARTREGMEPRCGQLAVRDGAAAIDASAVEIQLDGVRTVVDVANGQKTGSYLDQRVNHARVGALAAGRSVLDCYCFDGGFTLHALRNGAAHVTSVDSSDAAIAALRANLARNGLDESKVEAIEADVSAQLRAFRDARRTFDLIILDPPKFAKTRAHLEKAARKYKDINLLAMKLLNPGGLLATYSCSGAVDPDFFRTVVAEAAFDAGREATVLEEFRQAPDHPVSIACPEGLYLKGLLCRVK